MFVRFTSVQESLILIKPLKLGVVSPGEQHGLSPVTVTNIICNYTGNSTVTDCEKKMQGKWSQVTHVHRIIIQQSCNFLSNKNGKLPQKFWQLNTQYLCWVRCYKHQSPGPQTSLFYPIFKESIGIEKEARYLSGLETSMTLKWLPPPGPPLFLYSLQKALILVTFPYGSLLLIIQPRFINND